MAKHDHVVSALAFTVFLWGLIHLTAAVDPLQQNRCPSYCNDQAVKIREKQCSEGECCCGNFTFRECCGNASLCYNDYPDDVTICSNAARIFYQWQMLLGAMGMMVLVIVVAACCCQCCNLSNGGWQGAARARDDSRQLQARELSVIDVPENLFFDPDHPYAFTPPDYESLPKDPPLYEDIFGDALGGASNPACMDGEAETTLSRVGAGREASPSSQGPDTETLAPPTYSAEPETHSASLQQEVSETPPLQQHEQQAGVQPNEQSSGQPSEQPSDRPSRQPSGQASGMLLEVDLLSSQS